MARARRSGNSSRDSIRSRLLEQWWGAGERIDPEKNVTAASDLLTEILAKLRLEDGIEESRLRSVWKEVAGEFVAGQTEPVSFRKGVLTLKVLQPSMRFHLEQSRGEILSRLQQSLGKKKIREIRLTIG
ncbi:MAG: DUF721 domain-containing protein [Verrucomicrobia bacterium]|nr:DUF721 domain-containing protein [Verrucomicrobiota bacterium]MDA1006827.1 DUF721 domain-containing protein [Verrucomicrobiota bacterium]